MKSVWRTVLVFSVLASFMAMKQDQDWVKIAEKTVNFKAEKDVITPQGNERKVDKIRIKCIQGTVKLKRVHVEMSDGSTKDYDAKGVGVLSKGMTSFAWDLPGEKGSLKLKKVELEYDAVGNMLLTKKAKVELQGRLAPDS